MALTDKLSSIGNAIRAKTGKEEMFTLDQMPTEIAGIFGGGTLGPISVTENGTYYPTCEAATVTWDENTEYDGTLTVDDIPLRYKKVTNLTVPDDVSVLYDPGYAVVLTQADGTATAVPLCDLNLDSFDGVYMAYSLGFAVVWIKDATLVNAGYGASLEDNTVYITDYLWLAEPDEFAGATVSLTAPGQKIDGISSVTVDVKAKTNDLFVYENGSYNPGEGYDGFGYVYVDVPVPDGYIQPSGAKTVTQNGSHDIADYAQVVVNVPVPDGYIQPSGTKTVTENGTHDVADYAQVDVEIPDPVLQEKTVTENGEVTPDDGYDGLSKVTVAVESYGGSMAVNGIVKQYKVHAGANVNAGDFVEFVTNYGGGTFTDVEAVCMAACKLDNTRVFVVYASSSYIYAEVLTVTNQAVVAGKRITITSYTSSIGYVAAASVGSSRVIVSYYGIARLFSIDGTNITAVGNSLTCCTGDNFYSGSAASIHDNMAAIACAYKSGNYYYPVVCLVDVTSNEPIRFAYKTYSSSNTLVDVCVVKLTTNKIAFLHSHDEGIDLSVLVIEDTGLREITTKTIYSYTYSNSNYAETGIRAAVLSENLLLVSYRPRSTGTYNEYMYHNYRPVTIDESGITVGSAYALETGGMYATGVGRLSDSSALLVYRSSEKDTATVLKLDVTQTTTSVVKCDLGIALAKTEKGLSTLIPFSDDRMLLVSCAGIAAIYRTLTVDTEGVTVHTGTEDVDTYVQPATSRSHNVGIAAESGSEGDMIGVHVAGIRHSETTYENYFTSSVKEITSGAELTSTVSCGIGDLIIAAVATRDTLTVSDGWYLISTSEVNSTDTNNQRLSWAYKYAESTEESITVTQASEQRLYINMIAIPGATGFVDNGYTYNDDTTTSSITASKPEGLVLWGMTATSWTTSSPYKGWETSSDMQIIQLDSSTQRRLGIGLDQSDDASVTFKAAASTQSIIGCLTVQGIGKFYTATTHTWLE